jgi:hypothetical protein
VTPPENLANSPSVWVLEGALSGWGTPQPSRHSK